MILRVCIFAELITGYTWYITKIKKNKKFYDFFYINLHVSAPWTSNWYTFAWLKYSFPKQNGVGFSNYNRPRTVSV